MWNQDSFQKALFYCFVEQDKLRTFKYGGSHHLKFMKITVTFELLD
jgi:hypothetical protein